MKDLPPIELSEQSKETIRAFVAVKQRELNAELTVYIIGIIAVVCVFVWKVVFGF